MRLAPIRSLPWSCFSVALALLTTACDPSAIIDASRAARTALGTARRADRPPRVVAGQPLPAGGLATAGSPDVALARAWFDRNFVTAYRRVGRHNPKWDPAVESFIRDSGPWFLGLTSAEAADLIGRGRQLVQAGCDDPVVLYLAAETLLTEDDDSREVSELMGRAVTGMHDVAYPRAAAWFVASGLRADYDRRDEGTGKRAALAPVELGWFLESLKDGSYSPDEDVVFVRELTSRAGEPFFDRNRAAIVAALESTPWVDPWVRHLFAGMRYKDDAWDARGTAYAKKVKPEGWKGFTESLDLARRELTESWRMRPDRPEAASRMIGVAMGKGAADESPRLWFDRAVAARLDDLRAYRALIQANRTRWGGDPDALVAFARECAATRRFDTEVPMMAFEAVEQMESDVFDEAVPEDDDGKDTPPAPHPPSPYRDEEVYRLVSTVLERYRRDPGVGRWQRYASLEAAIAYKAGRYDEARKALEAVGGDLDDEATDAVDEPMLEERIEASASPAGEQIRRAEDLYRMRRTAEALALFEAARPKVPATALPYVDDRIATARLETSLQAGRTVSFLPPDSLAGWTTSVGEWTTEPDGALVGTSAARGLLIGADARVGPDFEIAADIEIVSTSNGQFQSGIVFGPHLTFESEAWSSFRLKRTSHEGDVVHFSRHFQLPVRTLKHPVGLRNRVVVQSWNGRLWAYLEGQPVVTNYAPEWKMSRTADALVGFGGYANDNTVVVRYRNVRLRRLTAPPVAPAASQATAVAAR